MASISEDSTPNMPEPYITTCDAASFQKIIDWLPSPREDHRSKTIHLPGRKSWNTEDMPVFRFKYSNTGTVEIIGFKNALNYMKETSSETYKFDWYRFKIGAVEYLLPSPVGDVFRFVFAFLGSNFRENEAMIYTKGGTYGFDRSGFFLRMSSGTKIPLEFDVQWMEPSVDTVAEARVSTEAEDDDVDEDRVSAEAVVDDDVEDEDRVEAVAEAPVEAEAVVPVDAEAKASVEAPVEAKATVEAEASV